MNRGVISGIMLALLLTGMFTLAHDIQPVKSDWAWTETIYIRADGSVDPPTAPISTVDNITYTLTDNIVGDVSDDIIAIVVERDNIVVDGAGYTLQMPAYRGITLTRRNNVTIKNMEIKSFAFGIKLSDSSNNTISGNNITTRHVGISLSESSNNTIIRNNIEANDYSGIEFTSSSNNTISRNNVANNRVGIVFSCYSNNTIMNENNIKDNGLGIWFSYSSSSIIYHNNLINNLQQVSIVEHGSANFWDDGYLSGGNYWSDHICTGNPSDGSQPYIIDENNIDHYPFQDPDGWIIPPSEYALTIHSSPTGIPFTVDDTSHVTPWSGTYSAGASVSFEMPEIQTVGGATYYWNQWNDGNTSRSRTVIMNRNIALTAYYSARTETHPGDSMWIEPSNISLTVLNPTHTIGYKFNVTIYLNITTDATFIYQVALLYNRTQLKATRGLVTGLWSSEFMQGYAPTVCGPLIDGGLLGNGSVLFCEGLTVGEKIDPPRCGATIWIEFEVLMVPPEGEILTSKIDISSYTYGDYPNPGDSKRNWVMNPYHDKILDYAYDSTYTFGWEAPPIPDLNWDGVVDGDDLYPIAVAFGSYPEHANWNPLADLNNDGVIDGEDLFLVIINFGKSNP